MCCGRYCTRHYSHEPAWVKKAYDDYTKYRQTFADLSRRYRKDPKTIRKHFDRHRVATGEMNIPNNPINLLMDATFFTRSDGIMVARANSKNLYWFSIASEKVEHYGECLDALESAGYTFLSFTIDGRQGVRKMLQERFPGIPVQHCQYHQLQTITQKLTQRPKLLAGKDLRAIALTIAHATRTEFSAALDAWYDRWEEFLKEHTYSPDRKRGWRYTHEKLRSAYCSLRRNLPWLFTYLDHPGLHIPNTTNSCDGSFTHWKNKVKIHRGIRKDRKKKMVDYLLEG